MLSLQSRRFTLSRKSLKPALRKTLLVLAVASAIAIPASQAQTGWGIDQRQFSASGDQTLRAAGYAFSIWGLIYAGLAAHAIAQLAGRGGHERLLAALSPAILAIAGCGAWIVAAGLDARWPSVAIILGSAASAVWALMRARGLANDLEARLVSLWPIALLGGWLLIASALNILTVMTAEGLIGPEGGMAYAVGGIGVVAVLGILAIRSGVSAVYGLPIAWGLGGVFAAERTDQPTLAYVALGAAALVLAASAWLARRRGAA